MLSSNKKWWWIKEFVKLKFRYLLSLLPNNRTLWNIHRRVPSCKCRQWNCASNSLFVPCHNFPCADERGASPAASGVINGWVPRIKYLQWLGRRAWICKNVLLWSRWIPCFMLQAYVAAQQRSGTWNPCWLTGNVWTFPTIIRLYFVEFHTVTQIIHPSCNSCTCEASLGMVSWLSLNFCREISSTRNSWALFCMISRWQYDCTCSCKHDCLKVCLVVSREAFVGPPTAFLRRGTGVPWVSLPRPTVCHRFQDDSVTEGQPIVVVVGVVNQYGRRVRVEVRGRVPVQLRTLTSSFLPSHAFFQSGFIEELFFHVQFFL